MRTPVIIDTDPGVDDFFALTIAAASEKLDIKAVTVVAGNQSYEKVCKNTLDIAAYLGITAPVYGGADKPMIVSQKLAGEVHGANGLGNIVLPKHNLRLSSGHPWDVFYSVAKECENKLHIIAIGPLTNIAIAFMKYPDLSKMLSGITIMGGTTGFGNHSQYAEFNIWADPHAASIVFRSGVKINMFGLNAADSTRMEPEEFRNMVGESKISPAVYELIDFIEENGKKRGISGFSLYDAVAVAYVIDPSIAEMMSTYVAVECRSEHSMGQTVIFSSNRNRIYKVEEDNANVAMKVDPEKFKVMLMDSFKHFSKFGGKQ